MNVSERTGEACALKEVRRVGREEEGVAKREISPVSELMARRVPSFVL